jgi:FO synthase
MLEEAGKLAIPFTTGILVGIGETALERVEALLAIAALHARYGHIQEVIVQNFTPHERTPMSSFEPPTDREMAHAIALARLILPDEISVQAPPNLNAERTALLVESGVNDFGGISRVTVDYINPDRPWPEVTALGRVVSALGFELSPRLAIYDAYVDRPGFLEPTLRAAVNEGRRRLAAHAATAGRAPRRDSPGEGAGAERS